MEPQLPGPKSDCQDCDRLLRTGGLPSIPTLPPLPGVTPPRLGCEELDSIDDPLLIFVPESGDLNFTPDSDGDLPSDPTEPMCEPVPFLPPYHGPFAVPPHFETPPARCGPGGPGQYPPPPPPPPRPPTRSFALNPGTMPDPQSPHFPVVGAVLHRPYAQHVILLPSILTCGGKREEPVILARPGAIFRITFRVPASVLDVRLHFATCPAGVRPLPVGPRGFFQFYEPWPWVRRKPPTAVQMKWGQIEFQWEFRLADLGQPFIRKSGALYATTVTISLVTPPVDDQHPPGLHNILLKFHFQENRSKRVNDDWGCSFPKSLFLVGEFCHIAGGGEIELKEEGVEDVSLIPEDYVRSTEAVWKEWLEDEEKLLSEIDARSSSSSEQLSSGEGWHEVQMSNLGPRRFVDELSSRVVSSIPTACAVSEPIVTYGSLGCSVTTAIHIGSPLLKSLVSAPTSLEAGEAGVGVVEWESRKDPPFRRMLAEIGADDTDWSKFADSAKKQWNELESERESSMGSSVGGGGCGSVRSWGEGQASVAKIPKNGRTVDSLAREGYAHNEIGKIKRVADFVVAMRRCAFVENEVYLILDRCKNGSCVKYLSSDARLSDLDRLTIVKNMWGCLKFLHDEAGWAHLDVKPENFMCAEGLGCRLCDFGFSVKLEACPRGLEDRRGTRGYRPPSLKGNLQKADVFSLGIPSIEILTGQRFEGVADLSGLDISPLLRDLFCRCLSSVPEHRPWAREGVEIIGKELDVLVMSCRSSVEQRVECSLRVEGESDFQELFRQFAVAMLQKITDDANLESCWMALRQTLQAVSGKAEFSALKKSIEVGYPTAESRRSFYLETLPFIVHQVFELDKIPEGQLHLLRQKTNDSLTLEKNQCCAILANEFFSTFLCCGEDSFLKSFPKINFDTLFNSPVVRGVDCTRDPVVAKIRCLLEYFDKMREGRFTPTPVVVKRVFNPRPDDMISFWRSQNVTDRIPMIACVVGPGSMRSCPAPCRQVDFATRKVGRGAAEMVLMAEYTELHIMKFCEELTEGEVVVVTGAEKFARTKGYDATLQHDDSPFVVDEFDVKNTEFVAMDALDYHFKSRETQFQRERIKRDIWKAYVGFKDAVGKIGTGNWGTGGGTCYRIMKFFEQWIACSAAGVDMYFYTFEREESGLPDVRRIKKLRAFVVGSGISVGQCLNGILALEVELEGIQVNELTEDRIAEKLMEVLKEQV